MLFLLIMKTEKAIKVIIRYELNAWLESEHPPEMFAELLRYYWLIYPETLIDVLIECWPIISYEEKVKLLNSCELVESPDFTEWYLSHLFDDDHSED